MILIVAIALIGFAFSSTQSAASAATSDTAITDVQETAATDIGMMTLANTDLDAALASPIDVASTTAGLGFGDAAAVVTFALLATILGTGLYVLWHRWLQTQLRDETGRSPITALHLVAAIRAGIGRVAKIPTATTRLLWPVPGACNTSTSAL
ncbi:MAG TPA: hypothetical protein VF303_01690 [Candidatus Nanoarchaeia archaeon]